MTFRLTLKVLLPAIAFAIATYLIWHYFGLRYAVGTRYWSNDLQQVWDGIATATAISLLFSPWSRQFTKLAITLLALFLVASIYRAEIYLFWILMGYDMLAKPYLVLIPIAYAGVIGLSIIGLIEERREHAAFAIFLLIISLTSIAFSEAQLVILHAS